MTHRCGYCSDDLAGDGRRRYCDSECRSRALQLLAVPVGTPDVRALPVSRAPESLEDVALKAFGFFAVQDWDAKHREVMARRAKNRGCNG